MPITCSLLVPPAPALVAELRQCPTLMDEGAMTPAARAPSGDRVHLNVVRIALEEDIYGHQYELPAEVRSFLAPYAADKVLGPRDLESALRHAWKRNESPDIIGRFRPEFLGFVRHVAEKHRATLEVVYEHERGDFPYETAYWRFDFKPGALVREAFGITEHDEGRWSAEIFRMADGQVHPRFERFH